MTPAVRLGLLLGAPVLLAGAATVAYFALQVREASKPPAPERRVPEPWRELRAGHDHRVHVQQEAIACERCHGKRGDFLPPPPSVCAECHAEQARMRHGLAGHAGTGAELAECRACHGFGPEPEPQALRCLRCHEEPQGALAALRADAHEDCGQCHKPHAEPSIQARACRDCHPTTVNTHGNVGHGSAERPKKRGRAATHVETQANCLTCHDAHGSASLANERCGVCHAPQQERFRAHEACSSCHLPHAFERADSKACRDCHAGQPVLAEQRVAAHRECTACHDPHAASAGGDTSCRGCHEAVSPGHPEVQGQSCIGCHAPHGARASTQAARPCTVCHGQLVSDRAAHGGKAACTQCHRPHAFEHTTQATACTHCHGAELAATARVAHGGHGSCLGCHQGHPHEAELSARPCVQCHADAHVRQGHAQCTACHEPHSGAAGMGARPCGSCHAPQVASVRGTHELCGKCHSAHQGELLQTARCDRCHAQQAKQGHAQIQGGCTSCHTVHAAAGPKAAPACTSCHARTELPGLHALPQHAPCSKCHEGAHDRGPFSERATCLSCHRDRQQHAPGAASCEGCHVFSR